MSRVIANVTLIDGVAEEPKPGQSIWIEGGRIGAVGDAETLGAPSEVEVVDATGKFAIPGLMDANVHLLMDVRMETLVRYRDRFEDLILEGAQLTLRNGLTTIFDTAGPRRYLQAVRDRIARGDVPGSRLFCAGFIMGFDGPFSADFYPKTLEVASGALVEEINSIWVENIGPSLLLMTPHEVAREVDRYIARGTDFVKYAANDHMVGNVVFSSRAQTAIVSAAHARGVTAQAHTISVEGVRDAIEAGCDLIQHLNITGPRPLPADTLDLLVERRVGAVTFAFTDRRTAQIRAAGDPYATKFFASMDENIQNLLGAGANILLGTDAGVMAPTVDTDPVLSKGWAAPGEDNVAELGDGHFYWLAAMEEKGMAPMEMLKAATINIATAYGKDADLGTLQPGKVADLVLLDQNPLTSARHYRSISAVYKDGVAVDRMSIPTTRVLTSES